VEAEAKGVMMPTLQPVIAPCREHQPSQDDTRTQRVTIVVVPTSFIEESGDGKSRTRVVWSCSRRDCHNAGCEYSAKRRQKERGYEV